MKKYIDLKLLKYLVLFYTIVEAVGFIKLTYYKKLGLLDNLEIPFLNYILYNSVLKWCIVISLMILVSYATKLMFDRWGISKKIIWIHLIIGLSIGLFIFLIMTSIIILIDPNLSFNNFWLIYFNEYIEFLDYNFLVYFSMTGIIYIYFYIKKTRKIEKQKSKLESKLSQAKLQFLQNQIQPHFLFNTLNSIQSLIDIDPRKSKEVIVDLSTILRELLKQKNKNLVELQDELSILKKYINIIKVRFSDQLTVEINQRHGLENILVPNMLIQPIVENSIKHGMIQNQSLKVTVSIYKTVDKLIIKVNNNGKSLSEALITVAQKRTGVQNTIDRLNTLYNGDFDYSIENTPHGVVNKISFPISNSVSNLLE